MPREESLLDGGNFSATRSLADRARGFLLSSASDGVIGLRVTIRNAGWRPQVHCGNEGGQMHPFA